MSSVPGQTDAATLESARREFIMHRDAQVDGRSNSGLSMSEMTDLTHLALTGAEIRVRVTPKASRNAIVATGDEIRVYVTVVPESGKANEAVIKLMAKALGVPKTRLRLLRGATSRDKVFRIE